MGRTSVSVPFYTDDIRIKEVVSASEIAAFSLVGKMIGVFTKGQPASLEKFDNGAYVLRRQDGKFIEFFA